MIRIINKYLGKWYLPISLKYISLIAFILIIIVGLSANASDPAFLKILRNTNIANLFVWSYWWPSIIIMAIFFGRIWCMICPVEIITTFFAKIGFKKKRPKWLLSGWAITIFYILILFIGIQGIAIHRNPYFMSIYLLSIVGVSIIAGVIFEKNTFCRYICPVGYLLGIYSKLSFLGLRVKDKNVCETCKDKSCINKKYQYDLNYKSCGVDLYPCTIEDSTDCILCAGCIKTCGTYKSESNSKRPNLQLKKIGFAKNLFTLKPLRVAEMVFVMIVSGFVISEILSEWKITDSILEILPETLLKPLDLSNKIVIGFLKSIILFGLVPFVIWILPYIISKLFGMTLKLKEYFLNYSLAFIPIMASAHLSKAILKTTSRIPYFDYLFHDIIGIDTAQQILDNKIILAQNPSIVNTIVSVLITSVMIIGIWISAKVIQRINKKNNLSQTGFATYLIPLIYGGIFLVMIIAWRWG